MKINLPNFLTLFRVAVLLPLAVLFFYSSFSYSKPLTIACVVLIILTDYFDGYFARKWKQGTPFGAFLDPVADKLVVATGSVILSAHYSSPLITVCCIIIVAREIIISALREWMAELGKRVSVRVLFIGKLKVNFQAFAFLSLLIDMFYNSSFFFRAGVLLLLIAVFLTLWSMMVYLRCAWPDFVAASVINNKSLD